MVVDCKDVHSHLLLTRNFPFVNQHLLHGHSWVTPLALDQHRMSVTVTPLAKKMLLPRCFLCKIWTPTNMLCSSPMYLKLLLNLGAWPPILQRDTSRHEDGQSKDSAEQRLQICPLKWDLSSVVVAHIVT